MSSSNTEGCPDWTRFARGVAPELADSAGREIDAALGYSSEAEWEAALAHQRHCHPCREAAIATDPSVIFQSLPEIALSSDEVEAMRHRVAGVLRGRQIDSSSRPSKRPSKRHRGAQSFAAAAGLVAVVSLGSLTIGWPSTVGATGLTAAEESLLEAALSARPLVDGIDVYGSETNILMQGASEELDFAWVADGDLEP